MEDHLAQPPDYTPKSTAEQMNEIGAAVTAAVEKKPRKRKPQQKRKPPAKAAGAPMREVVEADIMCEMIDLPAAAIISQVAERQPAQKRPWWRTMLSI